MSTTTINTRSPAERAYWAFESATHQTDTFLISEADPDRRAILLELLAGLENGMAALHTQVHGPDLGDDGRDVAESLALSARVLHVLASVQRSRHKGWSHQVTDPDLEQHAVGVLAWMVNGDLDHDAQADALTELHDQLEPHIGEQAAETIVRVAEHHRVLATHEEAAARQ